MSNEMKTPLSKQWWPWLTALLVLVMLALLLPDTNRRASTRDRQVRQTKSWKQADNSIRAYIMVEDWVRERLKSPSTADFPGAFDGRADHIRRLPNQRYGIASWVDSQNAFGATIRTHFAALVQQISKDDWILEDLDFVE